MRPRRALTVIAIYGRSFGEGVQFSRPPRPRPGVPVQARP
jgi:hypothetical protein